MGVEVAVVIGRLPLAAGVSVEYGGGVDTSCVGFLPVLAETCLTVC